MATLNKNVVPVAVANHTKLDVSSTHITSSSFMQLQPVYYRNMIPGEHLTGVGNVLSRLAPVAVPSYGRCRINMRAFWVPFRTVFPNFNEYITETVGSNFTGSSIVGAVPQFQNDELVAMFLTGGYNLAQIVTPPALYDFEYNGRYYALTRDGMVYMKILESLGYKVMFAKSASIVYSALPLLCYARVYYDWYANTQYMDSNGYLQVKQLFAYNDPITPLKMSSNQIFSLLSFVEFVCYDSGKNVFLNAWDNPVAPNSGNFNPVNIPDITNNQFTNIQLGTNGTPVMIQASSGQSVIGSDYIHTMLSAVTQYMKRNQLSGSKAVDRFLSRFGILLDSSKVDRSVYLSSQSIDVDFGSVMSNADTTGASLGDYAGVGFGRGSLNIDFKCDEFGLFIICASIVPDGSFYQGYDKNNVHIYPLDFYQPEYDQLGCDSISRGEVYVSNSDTFVTDESDYFRVFGFAPRYYEYKQGLSRVTGMMKPDNSLMQGAGAWNLFRQFDDGDFQGDINNLVHSLNLTRGTDFYKYDRVFQYTNGDIDNFYLVYNFDIQALSPCKSLFDSFEFEDAGKPITVDSAGAKVN